jgi:hypothetical protein
MCFDTTTYYVRDLSSFALHGRTLRRYYSGGAWAPPKGGIGGGTVVNEAAFKAVAAGLKQQDLLGAVKVWQLDDWCVLHSDLKRLAHLPV